MDTLLLLLPDLALIATGTVLARGLGWGDEVWAGLERLVYLVLFPALLFTSIVRHRIDLVEAAPLAGATFAVLAVGIALGRLGARLWKVPPMRFASAVQCAFRFNSYVALALAQRLGGEAGVATCAVVVAIAVPLGNAAAVWHLARHSGAGGRPPAHPMPNAWYLAAAAGSAVLRVLEEEGLAEAPHTAHWPAVLPGGGPHG
jgi:predicted permease